MAKAKTATPAKKTECPITRDQFGEQAKGITVVIDGRTMTADPKEFSTGSMGWNINDKADVRLADGTSVRVQIGVNLTVIGSKDLPK